MVVRADSFEAAMIKARATGRRIWIAGGSEIYAQALASGVVEQIDMTRVQATVDLAKGPVVKMSVIDVAQFFNSASHINPTDPSLLHETWVRKLAA